MAVHSLVFWAVVSHSQKRKKRLSTGCRSSALWAEWRCRYRVTLTMVMCVITRVTAISCHAERSRRPLNHIKYPQKSINFDKAILRRFSLVLEGEVKIGRASCRERV